MNGQSTAAASVAGPATDPAKALENTVLAGWHDRLAGNTSARRNHWQTKVVYFRAVTSLLASRPGRVPTWKSVVAAALPLGRRSTFYEVAGAHARHRMIDDLLADGRPDSVTIALLYRRTDAVEQLIDETKVWSYWPYRQRLLTSVRTEELTDQQIEQALTRSLTAWARCHAKLAAALDHSPPACAVEDLVVLMGGDLSGARAADRLSAAIRAGCGEQQDVVVAEFTARPSAAARTAEEPRSGSAAQPGEVVGRNRRGTAVITRKPRNEIAEASLPGSPGPGSGTPPPGRSGDYDHDRDAPARRLRELAREGRLAAVVAAADRTERQALTAAAYDVVWPIVFSRLTRGIEQRRGHPDCALGIDHLADECLDRFHDDVEAVVEDVLTHARQPVLNLEAWITGRLNAATVDGHRRRRGMRGALQRPRLPGWLTSDLGGDDWLTALATRMLVWVGDSQTAGAEVWPFEAWAQERAAHTGDWSSDPGVVAREVETVLAAMRRRPQWYESYVERPLGRKQAPVAARPVVDGTAESAVPLALGDPHARVDSELRRLAATAVDAIDQRRGHGRETKTIVVEVIRAVFGGALTGTLDQAPHDVADPLDGVSGALADQATVDRIVATVRQIVDEGQAPHDVADR